MARRIPSALWLTAAVVIAVLAAGCSDSGSDSQGAGGLPGEQAAGATDPEAAASDGTASAGTSPTDREDDGGPDDKIASEEMPPSPLGAFTRGLLLETFSETIEMHPMVAQDELIYDCMTKEGFQFAPRPWLAEETADRAAQPDQGGEWVPEMGYGMADALLTPMGPTPSAFRDPNDAIKEGLSESGLTAWNEQYFECYDEAITEVFRPSAAIDALREITKGLNERIASDPRIAAATAEWSACMAERGHHYSDQDDINAQLNDVFVALMPRVTAAGGPERIDEALRGEIDDLMALEVEVATADFACKEPLEKVRYEVRFEHEERFVEENEDRLALWAAELPTVTHPPGEMSYYELSPTR